jgi:hypothetical protein
VASALKSLREAIPYDKVPRAFREPTTDQLQQVRAISEDEARCVTIRCGGRSLAWDDKT